MKKKIATLTIALALAGSAFACWYKRVNYIDYIYGANTEKELVTYEIVQSSTGNATFQKFHVENNKVVDLPLTVACKLTSGSVVQFSDEAKPEIVTCVLQYRVLPKGNWVTVKEYLTPSGTIPFTAPPFAYFGKNNIWPKDIKAGDVIMVRLYITDGMYQSGNLLDKCEDKLQNVTTSVGTKYTLPNEFNYTIGQTPLSDYDLGSGWCPNQCMTFIFSGKIRPVR